MKNGTILLASAVLNPASENIKKMLERDYRLLFADSKGVHGQEGELFRVSGKRSALGKALYALRYAGLAAWFLRERGRIKCIFGISEPNWFLTPFFLLAKKGTVKVFFPYDVTHFRARKGGFKRALELFCEKKNFLLADAIVYKGLKNELELLPFHESMQNKPSHHFREFLDRGLLQKGGVKKLSEKDGEFHLAYAGGVYLGDLPETESFWKFYPKITAQKIHLHVYSRVPADAQRRIRLLEKADSYLHFEGFKPHAEMVGELARYDYGLHMFGNGKGGGEKLLASAFANKNYDYISAGIPIICSDNLKAVCEFVKGNGIGFSVRYEELAALKEKLEKKKSEYMEMADAIRGFIGKMSEGTLFKRFISELMHDS